MYIFHLHHPHTTTDPGNKQPADDIEDGINPYGPEVNIADGGEFLDDGIRMKDQPFEEGEAKDEE